MTRALGAAIVVLAAGVAIFVSISSSPSSARLARGEAAYVSYCAMCHGDLGNGDGPLSKDLTSKAHITPLRLNDAAHLRQLGRARVREIVTYGGQHSGRSNLMPPWGEKLGASLVNDVVDYVYTLPSKTEHASQSHAALDRTYYGTRGGVAAPGKRLFAYYCVLCHGVGGRGDGVYADTVFVRHGVRPRDLTDTKYMATRTDKDLYTVITLGGMRTDRSPDMPTWDLQLTPAQIKDIVSYLRVISHTKAS
jgi:mono/diheme cytochrome c family protein